jgi:hypothetical protein
MEESVPLMSSGTAEGSPRFAKPPIFFAISVY